MFSPLALPLPEGVSVNWHQDCHYFGTASPRIISCGVYLEDTDEELEWSFRSYFLHVRTEELFVKKYKLFHGNLV